MHNLSYRRGITGEQSAIRDHNRQRGTLSDDWKLFLSSTSNASASGYSGSECCILPTIARSYRSFCACLKGKFPNLRTHRRCHMVERRSHRFRWWRRAPRFFCEKGRELGSRASQGLTNAAGSGASSDLRPIAEYDIFVQNEPGSSEEHEVFTWCSELRAACLK